MAPPDHDDGGARRWLRREVLLGLALGQFVSLLITSTGFSSSELARRGINAPTSQSLLNYILLAVVYGSVLIYRRQPLTIKWYYYLILGIIDVEANYIVVKSYQYTSLTSVMLLDCWSIPCVIVLTWIFLKTKYGLRKFIGVGVCVAGLILVVFSDVHASDRAKGPNPLKGDLLVIFGSMLYACSNVTEEYVIKKSNRVELMAMLGLFGAVISGIQISILERNELHSIKWNAGAVLPFLGFAVAMFLFYSTVPTVLKICGATMLNLSLLTSDMSTGSTLLLLPARQPASSFIHTGAPRKQRRQHRLLGLVMSRLSWETKKLEHITQLFETQEPLLQTAALLQQAIQLPAPSNH
ncbi:hypothetical protein EJB05_47956 [Eragrostis curvula]|uniref:Solute carrier family 35 member F1 n=1 Tax=Eragrostis curvula TaxID=38414 RepID=A0A5J9T1U5_9POAL|nr:hypothetical protein EJB05_47956 [Eragrostis curvula]